VNTRGFETFGERLKRLRLERDLMSKDLAAQARLSRSAIVSYERGRVTPGYWGLIELAKVLDVPIAYLMLGDQQ
jgi:transcriptional regulator with XRE-family HTH domain